MDRLGYPRYGAQGGDWGSAVTTSLGMQDGEHCAGIHITLAFNAAPKVEGEPTAVQIDLGDGRSEPVVQAGLDRRELLALTLQARGIGEMQIDHEHGDEAAR